MGISFCSSRRRCRRPRHRGHHTLGGIVMITWSAPRFWSHRVHPNRAEIVISRGSSALRDSKTDVLQAGWSRTVGKFLCVFCLCGLLPALKAAPGRIPAAAVAGVEEEASERTAGRRGDPLRSHPAGPRTTVQEGPARRHQLPNLAVTL